MSLLVSIALCTYNSTRFIKEQMDSLLLQSYKDLEIIIVDDASTDNTFSVLEQYRDTDPRIKLYRNERNLGLQANFNQALKLCSGTYICIADHDDIWHVNKVAIMVSKIGDNLLIYHDSSYITETGNPSGKTIRTLHRFVYGQQTTSLLYQNCISGHATLFSRELLSFLPPFVEPVYYDWWLGYTAACTGRLGYIKDILVQYRIHPQSVIQKDTVPASFRRISILESFLHHPLTPHKTRMLIGELIEGYLNKKGKSFSWKLFLTLIRNKKRLFYIRRKSLFSRYKFIVNECSSSSIQ